jgi:two-component system, response regulator PdtaR
VNLTPEYAKEHMRTILIVEDDELFRKALMTYLSFLGFRINTAGTAEEALEEAELSGVDMLLVDYHLPGMNGIELARTLHARDHFPRIVLMSGYLAEAIHEEARSVSIDQVLRKPGDMTSLQQTILTLCNNGAGYGTTN